jgi:hypothetical protein
VTAPVPSLERAIRATTWNTPALAGLPRAGHPASYFRWLPLGPDTRPDRIAAPPARRRVAVSTAEPFATTPAVPTPSGWHWARSGSRSYAPRWKWSARRSRATRVAEPA